MVFQGTICMKEAVLCAVLVLLGGANVSAEVPDRYRCIPTDGSPSYTTPGTCRGDVIRREPLSQEEIAELWEIKNRGRAFTRCTAADGRYSFHVQNDAACPSPTDKRSIEYAQKSIQRQKYDAQIVAQAVTSVAAASSESSPAAASPAPAAPTAPVAFAPAPAVPAAALPAPEPGSARSSTGFWGKLGWLALMVLGVWVVSSWRSGRSAAPENKPPRPAQRPAQSTSPGQVFERPVPKEDVQAPTPRQPTNDTANTANTANTADTTDMNQKAQELLAVLENMDAAATVPGGLAFGSALQQAGLDYSLQSLDRVDHLLDQIKAKLAPQRANWQSQSGTENFRLLLAFYLGTVISRQSGMPMQWYTHEQAALLMPPDKPLPDASWSRLVGVIAASSCVPLGVIEEKLFENEPEAVTCKAYVERFLGKLDKAFTPDMDENRRCAILLEAFFSDAPIHGGLAYRAQLKQAQLDYSMESLQRLDQLLRFLQPEIKPPYVDFVNRSESQNFMRLAAFYIGMAVARLGVLSVKWLDFAQARQSIPELEFQFETSSVCLLGGRVYFPLGLVSEILLRPNAPRNVPEWAKQVLQLAPPPIPSILQSSAQADVADPFDDTLQAAIRSAGFVAAWCMFMVEGGADGAPTVFVPGADGAGTFRDFSFYSDADSAFKAAYGLMDGNPDKAPYQVLSFDGFANLHTGRTDALTMDLRVYGGKPPSRQVEFHMTVICPYRNANDPKGFAIYSPKLSECSAADAMHGAIFKHFYLGIASYKSTTFDWFKYLDERV